MLQGLQMHIQQRNNILQVKGTKIKDSFRIVMIKIKKGGKNGFQAKFPWRGCMEFTVQEFGGVFSTLSSTLSLFSTLFGNISNPGKAFRR